MLMWYIIYPCGDRTRLAIAQVRDYEKSDWDIAYPYGFDDSHAGQEEARDKMAELGNKHGLRYPGQHAYLR